MISIIVPCKNRIEKLKLCIDSTYESIKYAMKKEKFEYEILVVNDHSNDGFDEEVKKIFKDVKIVDSDGTGPGYARNLGIRNTKGEYIFFTDSDCVVEKDWIEEGIKVLRESNALVVQGIPWLFQKNENVYFGDQEQRLYEIMFSTYLYDDNKTKMTDSRNLLMNRKITNVLKDEVFAEKMAKATAESRVFGNRCLDHNIEILFDKELRIYHEDSKSIEAVCKQKYRHGSGRIMIWKETPKYDYLEERYFTRPIDNGLDVDYILPAHASFLFGYFQSINDEKKYNEFKEFLNKVFKKYNKKVSDYEILNNIIKEYEHI